MNNQNKIEILNIYFCALFIVKSNILTMTFEKQIEQLRKNDQFWGNKVLMQSTTQTDINGDVIFDYYTKETSKVALNSGRWLLVTDYQQSQALQDAPEAVKAILKPANIDPEFKELETKAGVTKIVKGK